MSNENLNKKFNWVLMMIFVTVFQVITSTFTIVGEQVNLELLAIFAGFIAFEWLYFFIASAFFGQNNFELETIGFLFSGIGLTVCASVYDEFALKQIFAILLGVVVFVVFSVVLAC